MSNIQGKRYFWLKLKEDFFDDDAMSWIEEQKNGKEYELFYLKLCLKSMKHNGLLIRNVGDMIIPYDITKLAEITHTDVDTAMVAMEIFKKIGLVEIEDDGAFYMKQLDGMVGNETVGAAQRRALRASKKAREDNVIRLSSKNLQDIDKDIDIDKDKDNNRDFSEIVKFFEENITMSISSFMYQRLGQMTDEYGHEWMMHAMQTAVEAGREKSNIHYIDGILKNWKSSGYAKPWEHKKQEKYEGPCDPWGQPIPSVGDDWQAQQDELARLEKEELLRRGE